MKSRIVAVVDTMFENSSKNRTLKSGNTVRPQTSGFQKSPFLAFLMNVNVARFARNIQCDFFFDFQTL